MTDRRPSRGATRLLAAGIALAAALVLAPAFTTLGPGGIGGPPATAEAASVRARVLTVLNRARTSAGCRPLRTSAPLRAAAQRHTDRMAAAGRLDHQLADEPGLGVRVAEAGYPGARLAGEVIAGGARSASEVVRLWLGSPRHRAILLDCRMRDAGVGLRSAGGRWWTVDLGRR